MSLTGVVSQSSLLLQHFSKLRYSTLPPTQATVHLHQSITNTTHSRPITTSTKLSSSSSDFAASSLLSKTVDLSTEGIEIQSDSTGGDFGSGDHSSGGGGGGGGGGSGGGESNEGEGKEEEKKKMEMSMSQKLTLGYAALVGMGGLMGYLKSGSQKSVMAGGISASLLYYVYTQLPTNPVYASSIGLGISAALMGVMGSRFMRSKKVFPAGVVSIVSLIMTGGYLHGILRSMH